MQVRAFMVPAEKVSTCEPTDSIRKVLDMMLEKNIGAVVVLVTGTFHVPIGIVTKTDILAAYKKNLTLDHMVKEIMSKDLETVEENMSRDQAARAFEKNKNHHAIVVDSNKHFRGLISSWDIAVECAKDDRAWPWIRSIDGKFHKPDELTELCTSPTSTVLAPTNERPIMRRSQMGDSFRAYIDNLGYFD
jgi:CBS domain-containing protein